MIAADGQGSFIGRGVLEGQAPHEGWHEHGRDIT
jgi:hypothetical protein